MHVEETQNSNRPQDNRNPIKANQVASGGGLNCILLAPNFAVCLSHTQLLKEVYDINYTV